jgi:hypothetical protein
MYVWSWLTSNGISRTSGELLRVLPERHDDPGCDLQRQRIGEQRRELGLAGIIHAIFERGVLEVGVEDAVGDREGVEVESRVEPRFSGKIDRIGDSLEPGDDRGARRGSGVCGAQDARCDPVRRQLVGIAPFVTAIIGRQRREAGALDLEIPIVRLKHQLEAELIDLTDVARLLGIIVEAGDARRRHLDQRHVRNVDL